LFRLCHTAQQTDTSTTYFDSGENLRHGFDLPCTTICDVMSFLLRCATDYTSLYFTTLLTSTSCDFEYTAELMSVPDWVVLAINPFLERTQAPANHCGHFGDDTTGFTRRRTARQPDEA
jgi:hypothetical protein